MPQRIHSLSHRTTNRAHDCDCLNWRLAYRHLGATCGKNELNFATSQGASLRQATRQHARLVCERHQRLLNGTFCVNLAFEQWSGPEGQWCYVANHCKNLNGGKAGQGTAPNMKVCQGDSDELLWGKTVDQIVEIARANDVDVSVLLKQAYPTWRSEKWEDIEAIYEQNDAEDLQNGRKSKFKSEHKQLFEKLARNEPIIFDMESKQLALPYYVVAKEKVYKVQRTREATANPELEHMGGTSQVLCLHGC